MGKKIKIIARILFVFYIAAVCLLCFMQFEGGVDFNETFLGIPRDKWAHALMFFPFPMLFYFSFHIPKRKPVRVIYIMVLTVILGGLCGGAIELIQGTTGYRSADIGDFRADCIGLFAGCIVTLIYSVITKKW